MPSQLVLVEQEKESGALLIKATKSQWWQSEQILQIKAIIES